MIARCNDDCVDSGTGAGGRLSIVECVLQSCEHEAVALTDRPTDDAERKRVTVERTIVHDSQQGVELWTYCKPSSHL